MFLTIRNVGASSHDAFPLPVGHEIGSGSDRGIGRETSRKQLNGISGSERPRCAASSVNAVARLCGNSRVRPTGYSPKRER